MTYTAMAVEHLLPSISLTLDVVAAVIFAWDGLPGLTVTMIIGHALSIGGGCTHVVLFGRALTAGEKIRCCVATIVGLDRIHRVLLSSTAPAASLDPMAALQRNAPEHALVVCARNMLGAFCAAAALMARQHHGATLVWLWSALVISLACLANAVAATRCSLVEPRAANCSRSVAAISVAVAVTQAATVGAAAALYGTVARGSAVSWIGLLMFLSLSSVQLEEAAGSPPGVHACVALLLASVVAFPVGACSAAMDVALIGVAVLITILHVWRASCCAARGCMRRVNWCIMLWALAVATAGCDVCLVFGGCSTGAHMARRHAHGSLVVRRLLIYSMIACALAAASRSGTQSTSWTRLACTLATVCIADVFAVAFLLHRGWHTSQTRPSPASAHDAATADATSTLAVGLVDDHRAQSSTATSQQRTTADGPVNGPPLPLLQQAVVTSAAERGGPSIVANVSSLETLLLRFSGNYWDDTRLGTIATHPSRRGPHTCDVLCCVGKSRRHQRFCCRATCGAAVMTVYVFSLAAAVAVVDPLAAQWADRHAGLKGVNAGGWLIAERWMVGGDKVHTTCCGDVPGPYRGIDYATAPSERQLSARLRVMHDTRRLSTFRARYMTRADFARMAHLGLHAVRIPFAAWEVSPGLCGAAGVDYFVGRGIRHVDDALAWAHEYGLKVILDPLHGACGSQSGAQSSGDLDPTWVPARFNTSANLEALRLVATRYATAPAVIAIELLNEPRLPVQDALDFYQRASQLVRASGMEAERVAILINVFLLSDVWSTVWGSLNWHLPARDYPNMVYDWHLYYSCACHRTLPVAILEQRAKCSVWPDAQRACCV